jgi:osmotically-inducible protein OsmY
VSDISLRQNILDELEFEPSVDAAHIGVAIDDGVATLTGHVSSYSEKVTAERVIQRVKGVRGIAQEIEVRYPGAKKTADDEIAKRALNIISWSVTVPEDKVKITVSKGWVTLSGEVEWNYQKVDAENAVRKLSGVVAVSNLITVRPRVSIFDVKLRIEDALKRSAEIEATGVRVNVSGAKVTLEGNVHSWYERGVAERAAWAIPGVGTVEDRLVVG